MARFRTGSAAQAASGRRVYLFMALLLSTIVVFGFSHTGPHDLSPPGLPVLLQAHALIFVA